jgi:hypothetical protein
MSGRPARWATALLVFVNAGLGAVVVFELTGTLTIAPEVTAAPPPSPELESAHEPAVFEPPAREQLDEIAARPLFSPSRRPFVTAATEAALPTASAPLPPLELIGVLLTDQRRAALLRPLDGGAPGWVREDEAVAGWRLEKIERSRVHLAAGDRLEVVELRADTAVSVEDRWVGNAQQPPETAKQAETAKKEAAAAEETDEAGTVPSEEEHDQGAGERH